MYPGLVCGGMGSSFAVILPAANASSVAAIVPAKRTRRRVRKTDAIVLLLIPLFDLSFFDCF